MKKTYKLLYNNKLKAIKLLKPGGTLVYSTCTITLEENEEQVGWILNKFNNMKLVDQVNFV
jgi:16S rRNA C967 or C1407 C5-methylase (RsmB/RsmF family)